MVELPPPPVTRPLGRSGIAVSSLAWGMWRFKGDDVTAARSLVEAALESGITLLDTADIYGPDNGEPFGAAEALLGRVLREAPDLRDRMVLASKGGIVIGTPYDSSPRYLESAVDASLARLGVERLDLWQVHRPDILTHPQELARFAEAMVTKGKIAAFGVSNFTLEQVRTLAHLLPPSVPLASIQPEISALEIAAIEDGMLDLAMRRDLAVLAWSPLGGGRIAAPADARGAAVAAALDGVAEVHGVSRTAAGYSWLMAHPARPIPIVGSQQVARIREAADAYKVRWTRASWYAVLVAARGEPLP